MFHAALLPSCKRAPEPRSRILTDNPNSYASHIAPLHGAEFVVAVISRPGEGDTSKEGR